MLLFRGHKHGGDVDSIVDLVGARRQDEEAELLGHLRGEFSLDRKKLAPRAGDLDKTQRPTPVAAELGFVAGEIAGREPAQARYK